MSTICIIQARMGSTRLPGKVLMDLNGRPILDWVVRRIQAVNCLKPVIDKVVVATTTLPEDDLILGRTGHLKVECFRGHPTDVLERYYRCAQKYKADWILRVTADCPFIDPVLILGLLTAPRKDYQALAVNQGRVIDGQDAELFSFQELERVYKRSEHSEHVTTKMRLADQDFKDYGPKGFDFKGLKISIDTQANLEKAREYAKYL